MLENCKVIWLRLRQGKGVQGEKELPQPLKEIQKKKKWAAQKRKKKKLGQIGKTKLNWAKKTEWGKIIVELFPSKLK